MLLWGCVSGHSNARDLWGDWQAVKLAISDGMTIDGRWKGKKAFKEERKDFSGTERGMGIWGGPGELLGEPGVLPPGWTAQPQALLLQLYIKDVYRPRLHSICFQHCRRRGTQSAVRWEEGREHTQSKGTRHSADRTSWSSYLHKTGDMSHGGQAFPPAEQSPQCP